MRLRTDKTSAMKISSIFVTLLFTISIFLVMFTVLPGTVRAQQFARPDSDVALGGWTDAGSAEVDGVLWNSIDEVTADDSTSYIEAGSGDTTAEVGLSDITDPVSSTGHIMKFRAYASGGAGPERIDFVLMQGTTQIAILGNQAITRNSWNDYSYTLATSEADAITDYTDLRFRFVVASIGAGESIWVTWSELEVPNAPTGGGCQVLTVQTSDPSGQLWFNGTTDDVPGGLWQEENVSASYQQTATPALNVTNDDAADACDVTLQLASAPSTGRSMKYSLTSTPPNPGTNQVPSASNVTVCTNIAAGGLCQVWLWVDYQDAFGGQEIITLTVDTKPAV